MSKATWEWGARPKCGVCGRVITWAQFGRKEAEYWQQGDEESYTHTFDCEKVKFTRGHRPLLPTETPEVSHG